MLDDAAKVTKLMRETATFRHQWVKKTGKGKTVDEILDEFPHLMVPGMVSTQ